MPGSNSSSPDALPVRARPLGLTVHALPDPRLRDMSPRARIRAGRWRMLTIALVCALPVVASYLSYYVWRPGRVNAYSTLIQPTVPLPDVAVSRLDGTSVPLRSLAGQWLLVVVHGADCDPACERLLFLQRQLREMTGRERERIDKVWLVLDDAPVAAPLRAALEATPAMHILRLPRARAEAWLRPAPGQPLEAHLYIVDPLGEWMMRAPADPDPSKLKGDVERLLRASAGWDKPGRPPAAAPVAGASR
jgi:hypothetical protein